jgi:hypothetical protein
MMYIFVVKVFYVHMFCIFSCICEQRNEEAIVGSQGDELKIDKIWGMPALEDAVI